MKVLLVNTNTMKPAVSPIGLEYVGEYLRNRGVEVAVCDLCLDDDPEVSVSETAPDVIGITVRNTDDCTYPSSRFFLPEIKKLIDGIKKKTPAPIVLGGVGFSVMPEQVMRFLGADYGIYGDGEKAFFEFVSKYPETDGVPNLIYRSGAGYARNPAEYADAGGLSFGRDLFDNRRYFDEGGMGSVETKRGCDRRCVYCADPLAKGGCLRLRDPDMVAEELSALHRRGVYAYHFCDSEFNIPYEHAENVCRSVIKRGLGKKIGWYCYCSPVRFDASLAKLMKEAGCRGINFGADSGNDGILERLRRDHRAADLEGTGKACREAGLVFMYDLLLGSPGEDAKTLGETIGLMKRISPDIVGTAIGVRIYKDTQLARLAEEEGLDEDNRSLYGAVLDNADMLLPLFYISGRIGDRIYSLTEDLIGGDRRFIFSHGKGRKDYNYDGNALLLGEIKKGKRGAYWDILRSC
ncbi:MAG: cobalamin-dependent protein [Elusimicrobia bacterium]|nr:cobalamin-dependent protein [Elusimicrobiota bacterium]